MGEKRSRVLQIEQEVLKQKLSFIDHPPDKKIYGEDIKYEQALVEYLIFLNQVVQKEESAQEQNAVVPNERVEQMLQYISKNLSHPLSLEEMEKQFLSANTISHENLKVHWIYVSSVCNEEKADLCQALVARIPQL